MKTTEPEHIYNSSIDTVINKFISSDDDFFLTEKDLHFFFFHSCLQEESFVLQGKLLLHTEYPTPFKVTKNRDILNPVNIADDNARAMRPHIDSILFNKNFIQWINGNVTNSRLRDNYIRGLGNKRFSVYIADFRRIYKRYYDENNQQNILSHSLEFKFLRGGYEGVKKPMIDMVYDLKKLLLMTKKNYLIQFPFSKEGTLLIFIGERGSDKLLRELETLSQTQSELFSNFDATVRESQNHNRYVIRYDVKKS
jgi:hypothetical protein